MVNQQLLDYIKQQLGQNVSKEQIKSSLMSGGWLVSDVEEGFNAIAPQSAPVPRAPSLSPSPISNIQPIQSTQPIQPIQHIQPISNLINPTIQQPSFTKQEKPKSGKKAILFLVILIILAGGGYFALKYFDNSKTNNAPAPTPAVNQEANQTPATTPTPAPVVENPDITRVKAILVDIGQSFMTGNYALFAQHASIATAKFLTASSFTGKVSTFTVNSVIQSGANIVANATTTGGPSNQPPTQNLVFIKENGDWKLDMAATMQYDTDEANAKKGTGDPNGLPDLVVTGVTVSPAHPIVNDKNVQILIFVKNIGTKKADNVSFEVKILGFAADVPYQAGGYVLAPGETMTETYNPYKENDFFKISDTAGQKTIQIVLNKDRDMVESNYNNNVFTQVMQVYSN